MRQQVFYQLGVPSQFFEIPNDCNIIWVSGCGGGGGGGGGNATAGGGGGSPSPSFYRVPLSVTPNGVLTVRVGAALAGGASGASSQAIDTQGYNSISSISGAALISPLANVGWAPMFFLGTGDGGNSSAAGGTSNPPQIYGSFAGSPAVASLRMLNVNSDSADWNYSQKNFPLVVMSPIVTGDAAQAAPASPFSLNAAGTVTLNNHGLGNETTSDAIYGSGGAGGGGMFGAGGAGGVYSGGIGSGGTATGYGAGGGGGSGGPNPYGAGGDGSPGIVIIEY